MKWDVEPGSVVKLNGQSISAVKDSMVVAPLVTTTYTLIATGQISDTAKVVVTVLPTGKIMTFKAVPAQIGTGESVSLIWQVVKGSSVTLNGNNVPVVETRVVYPTLSANVFTLIGQGDVRDSITIAIPIQSPDQVDRALGAGVTVSSNDTVAFSFSSSNNIVDGNNFSRWQATANASQWVKLDLGISYSINQIVIRWGNKAYAKQYSVQASNNDSGWQVLTSVLGGTGGTNYVETLSGLHGSGRYVYFLLQAQGNGAYSISEISIYGTVFTGVESAMSELPTTYSLSQNFPNPFNPSTTINFSLIKASDVKLTIFNVLGQKVATLVDNRMNAGAYSVQFNAKDLSSGVYFYRIEAGDFKSNKKMLLLK